MNKNKADRLVAKIISMRPDMEKLTDAELAAKTDEFKGRLSKGESLMSLLPEAYAVVREASRRTTGLEQFPVQILSGIYLNAGYIAEQATGEGKTLAAAMPSYLNALSGEGVHVVTVNDYLANRDAEDIGRIHRFLGLTVGCIVNASSTEKRREAYDCDITYVTNTELGFDYLRDNMTRRMEDRVQRGFHYCIIDEVDSVLIDEARTPLIISGGSGKPTQIYVAADALAKSMERGEASGEIDKISSLLGQEITETGDFIVDEKDQIITLTAQGVEKAEKYFGLENLADIDNATLNHHINQALRAHGIRRLRRRAHQGCGEKRRHGNRGKADLVGRERRDGPADERPHDDGNRDGGAAEAVQTLELARAVGEKARVGAHRGAAEAVREALERRDNGQHGVAQRHEQGKDADKREARERGRKSAARTDAVGDHAREGTAHHEHDVDEHDEGRDLKGTGAELVGGTADEAHEGRGSAAHDEQEVCKDETARGRREGVPQRAQEGRHGVLRETWRWEGRCPVLGRTMHRYFASCPPAIPAMSTSLVNQRSHDVTRVPLAAQEFQKAESFCRI